MQRSESSLRTMKNERRRFKKWASVMGAVLLLYGVLGGAAPAQDKPAEAAKAATAVPASTNVAAIPLPDVAAQAEAAFATVQSIEDNLSADAATVAIQQDLPVLTRESSARLEESSKTLGSSPSLETLRRLTREWQAVRDELAEWKRSLMKRITQLEDDRARLTQLEQVWKATHAAVLEAKLPPEVLAQVERVMGGVKRTQDKADAQQRVVLSLQSRVAEQDGRAIHTINAIERAREAFIRRLFVRDGSPIWSTELWSESAQNLGTQGYHSFSRQAQALRGYFERKGSRFVLLAGLLLAILFGLLRARRALRTLGGEAASHAAQVFDSPVATALVLALLASSWIYPEAPRLLAAITGAAAVIPAILVVRRLIDRRLYPVLNALVVFYFVDQLRMVAASQAVLSRFLLLAEMLGGALFVGWLRRSDRFGTAPADNRFWKAVGKACTLAAGWFTAAFIADALGYTTLSKLLGHALLQSAYMALILYAVVRIMDGLLLSVLSVPPLVRLSLVRRHQELLRRRTQGAVTWAAILLWAVYVLEALSLRAPVFQDLREVLTATWTVGSFKLSPGDVVLLRGHGLGVVSCLAPLAVRPRGGGVFPGETGSGTPLFHLEDSQLCGAGRWLLHRRRHARVRPDAPDDSGGGLWCRLGLRPPEYHQQLCLGPYPALRAANQGRRCHPTGRQRRRGQTHRHPRQHCAGSERFGIHRAKRQSDFRDGD